jgi:FKBP-type peptidyl-prolyl cis-trans isomerase FkpA
MSNITAVPLLPVRRSYLIWLAIGIVAALVTGSALAWQGTRDPMTEFLASNAKKQGIVTTASGLQYEVLTPGAGGPTPADTDVTLVQYEGRLTNGTVFDKSQQPTPLPVTAVVAGFSEGLKLMPKGSKYRFWIPPQLGYGAEEKPRPDGTVAIPANSILVFDVELLDFLPEAVVRQMQMQQGMPGAAAPQGVPQQQPPQ